MGMWGIPEKNHQKLAQQCKLDHSNVLPAHEMTRSPFSGLTCARKILVIYVRLTRDQNIIETLGAKKQIPTLSKNIKYFTFSFFCLCFIAQSDRGGAKFQDLGKYLNTDRKVARVSVQKKCFKKQKE